MTMWQRTAWLVLAAASVAGMTGMAGLARAEDAAYEAGFQKRKAYYLDYVSADLDGRYTWAERVTMPKGDLGDPHKYVLPPIVARFAINPKDETALKAYRWLMTVDKQKDDRGLYHFAAYLRTRMYFQFKDQLPPDVTDSMRYDVTNFFKQLRAAGTENHTWMHRISGYLWTEELPDVGRQAVPGKEVLIPTGTDGAGPPTVASAPMTNQEWLKTWLRRDIKKLYTAGQGEYDSSTYIAFSTNAMSNIYDFSTDPKMRDLARAMMEWEAAAMALKYFHGMNMGPEARGFAKSAVETHTDSLGWLWWDGSARDVMAAEGKDKDLLSKHASVCAALSKFRPAEVTRNLATKNIKLPFESRGSKPSYYGYKDNKDQEYLYVSDQFAMSTLYSPEDGAAIEGTILPQTTMFKIAVLDKDNVRSFGMTNGYHGHFPLEGRTPFDQYHQKGAAALNICYVNHAAMEAWQKQAFAGEKDVAKAKKSIDAQNKRIVERSIFGVPMGIADPVQQDGWWFWQVNQAYVAARPLNGQASFKALTPDEKNSTHRWLVSDGVLTGWAVQLGQQPEYATLTDFQKAVTTKCKLDTTDLAAGHTATFTSLAGDVIKLHHAGGPGGKPEAWTNGQKLDFTRWPVYESPYLKEDAGSGVLKISDGRNTLTIDYSAEWPTFRESNNP